MSNKKTTPVTRQKNFGQLKPNLWNGKLDWIVMLRE